MALSTVLVACGARVGPYLGAAGTASDLGEGSSSLQSLSNGEPAGGSERLSPAFAQGFGANPGGGVTATGTDATSAPGATPSARPNAPSPLSPQGFDLAPSAEAGICTGSAGNKASELGVTPTSVTFGNVSGITGPLPNSFEQGQQAVQALFGAVDAAGGICGRRLLLDTEDDQQNASVNASDTEDLIQKVFAFAGSTSDADNGGVPAMQQARVPDLGFAVNCNRSQSATYWSPDGGSCYTLGGKPAIYDTTFALAKSYGYFPRHLAFLAYDIDISSQAAEHFAYVYAHAEGGSTCYENFSISPATASLAPDVMQMEEDRCDGVFTTLDVTGNAKLLQAMEQQDYHPLYVGSQFDSYSPSQITAAGTSAAQGFLAALLFVPLDDPNPAMHLYRQELATYEPGAEPSGFGFLAWDAGQMAIYALLNAGRNPTRQSFRDALASISGWDAEGSQGPYTPSTRALPPCEVDVVVKGGSFSRLAPSSGLFCKGTYRQAGP